jgi:hypothetical protein
MTTPASPIVFDGDEFAIIVPRQMLCKHMGDAAFIGHSLHPRDDFASDPFAAKDSLW